MQRQVRFARSVDVFPTPANDNFATSPCWYSKQDYDAFKKDARLTIRRVRRMTSRLSEESQDIALCTRGLENFISDDTLKHQQMMQNAVVDAVLDEQDLHCEASTGVPLQVALAVASRTKSRWARRLARATAKKDAEYVLEQERAEHTFKNEEEDQLPHEDNKQVFTVLQGALEVSTRIQSTEKSRSNIKQRPRPRRARALLHSPTHHRQSLKNAKHGKGTSTPQLNLHDSLDLLRSKEMRSQSPVH